MATAVVPVFALTSSAASRRLLTNQDGCLLTYGLVTAVENAVRRVGLRVLRVVRTYGLQPRAEVLPRIPGEQQRGGDAVNSLTNAEGRLPNDRPHMFAARRRGRCRLGFTLQATSSSWAANRGRPAHRSRCREAIGVLLEPRGTRRLPSLTMLDVRVSKTVVLGGLGRVEFLMDVLNAFNQATEEGLATDNFFSTNFGQPTVFVDPRRVMLGARMNLGR
jgi:hypothetical protein